MRLPAVAVAAMGKKGSQPKATAAKTRSTKKRPASPKPTASPVASKRKLGKTPTSPRTPAGRRELGVFVRPSPNQLASFFHVDVSAVTGKDPQQKNMESHGEPAEEVSASVERPDVTQLQDDTESVVDAEALVPSTSASASGGGHVHEGADPEACGDMDTPVAAGDAGVTIGSDPSHVDSGCIDETIPATVSVSDEADQMQRAATADQDAADTSKAPDTFDVQHIGHTGPEDTQHLNDSVVLIDDRVEHQHTPSSTCDVRPSVTEHALDVRDSDTSMRLERLRAMLFTWPTSVVDTTAGLAMSETAEYAEYLRAILNSLSISTSFSGVDAPSTALGMLSAGVLQQLGETVTPDAMPKTKNVWAVEWVASAQQELLHHPFGPDCVYGDINSFWLRSIAEKAESICSQRRTMAMLKEHVMSTTCTGRTAYCSACQRQCTISEADIHIGGTPCTDFSPRGDRDQLDGKTTLSLLSWVSMRRDVQEPYWVQENVPAFPQSVLKDLLSDIYEIQSCVVDPAWLGWPVVRRRQYIVGRHRTKATLPFHMSLKRFVSKFFCDPKCASNEGVPAWDVFFAASDQELRAEKQWAANRPTSLAQKNGTPADEADFQTCLTEMEQNFRATYETLCPGVCYSLCQNPAVSATHSTLQHLHTILKSAGTIWSDYHSRWLTAGEALMAQGFSVDPRLSHDIPMTSFSVAGRDERSIASRTARIGFAGNTMHVQCVALVLLYILSHGAMPLHQIQSAGVSRSLCRRMRLPNTLSRSLMSIASMVAKPA